MTRVMVFGTFDILHPGHIHFLERAKKYGDFLIVSLAREANVKKIKGRAPRHTELERKKMLGSLRFVDRVVLGAAKDYVKHILQLRPDVIALGYDQKAYTAGLKQKLQRAGLKTKIVRVRSHKPHVYKTSKLRPV